jgi:RNA-dependent RNA polymerase
MRIREFSICVADPQPTFWNTWRWVFHLTTADIGRLKSCQHKLRMIAEEDPQVKLLAKGAPRWDIRKLDAEAYHHMYGMPDLTGVPFAIRTLIEGLVAHGILRPGDTAVLWEELKRNAVADTFKCRILESLYNEERIRDVKKIVPGEFGAKQADISQSALPPSNSSRRSGSPRLHSYRSHHPHPSGHGSAPARTLQQCHSTLPGQARRYPPRTVYG